MSDGLIIFVAIIWIGWPLHNIAQDIRALRKLARKEP